MMSQSTKPYLTRALWEWCEDNQLTALLHVRVEGVEAQVPRAFVKDGQIVLNISATATRHLTMDNGGGVEFTARFNGVAERIKVPWHAVLGLFARETGEGMVFSPDEEENVSPDAEIEKEKKSPVLSEDKKKPTLTVIK